VRGTLRARRGSVKPERDLLRVCHVRWGIGNAPVLPPDGRSGPKEAAMTREEHRTIVTEDPLGAPGRVVAQETHDVVEVQPSGGEVARRVTVFVFGIIQLLLVIRIVLMLVNANEAQPLVGFLLALSQPFVAPFQGILGSDAVASGGAVIDVAAVVALAGWSVLELVVLWLVNVFRREPS
jgi:uncharacterized protein YggT (Ycf19 family)